MRLSRVLNISGLIGLGNLKERLEMWFADFEEEGLVLQNWGAIYLRKRQIEHEKIGTYAGIKISQDADNADQTGKWFLKVHKTYKLL